MEKIWAPWRMKYIQSDEDKRHYGDCLFCDLPKEGPSKFRENLILSCGEKVFIILNRYPYTNGHLLIVPRVHVPDPSGLSDDDYHILSEVLRNATIALQKTLNPDGINLGMNIGRVAGAGIADHCHYHLVPRWNGDTNFMPVMADVRVISVGLKETYDQLFPSMSQLCE